MSRLVSTRFPLLWTRHDKTLISTVKGNHGLSLESHSFCVCANAEAVAMCCWTSGSPLPDRLTARRVVDLSPSHSGCHPFISSTPPTSTKRVLHWEELTWEGNIVSFPPIKPQGIKEHFPPSTPSPPPASTHSTLSSEQGMRGDSEISVGVRCRIQSSRRENWCPDYLA